MPLSVRRVEEMRKRVVTRPLRYGERFRCPRCGAVHHFDSNNGCHNTKCDYTGFLEPEKKVTR